MFKKYVIRDGDNSLDFFVHSKKTRNGFAHEACWIGLPNKDPTKCSCVDVEELFKCRYMKVGYLNRTWELWSGQTVLVRLWEKLEQLKDKYPVFGSGNPFGGEEPPYENLPEPDDLFGRFQSR